MELLNYKTLREAKYSGYVLQDAPVRVLQFGEGNFLRAFVDYFFDVMNEKGCILWKSYACSAHFAGARCRN